MDLQQAAPKLDYYVSGFEKNGNGDLTSPKPDRKIFCRVFFLNQVVREDQALPKILCFILYIERKKGWYGIPDKIRNSWNGVVSSARN